MECKNCGKKSFLDDNDAGTDQEIYKVCSVECVAEYEKHAFAVFDDDCLGYESN